VKDDDAVAALLDAARQQGRARAIREMLLALAAFLAEMDGGASDRPAPAAELPPAARRH
jgi:hypothetical protein